MRVLNSGNDDCVDRTKVRSHKIEELWKFSSAWNGLRRSTVERCDNHAYALKTLVNLQVVGEMEGVLEDIIS